MARKVEYKFDIDQRVVTPFGEDGIVTMLGYDDGGQQYYVREKERSNWFKESQLCEAKQA